MFKFLRVLFGVRKKKVTLILVQENKPAEPESFSFYPKKMFQLNFYIAFLAVVMVFLVLSITPLGSVLFDREDAELRSKAIELKQKLNYLSDSLKNRDILLKSIQGVIRNDIDTLFQTTSYESLVHDYLGTDPESIMNGSTNQNAAIEYTAPNLDAIKKIDIDKIIYSGKFTSKPLFPALFPVNGTLSQKFDSEKKHYGIDIAASKGSIVRSLADGVVISADWSINYGNTIQIQHGDGYISIIKHCSSLLKKEGDVVLRGDGIGVLGFSGVINSGPHIHVELWRDGVALDPELYLITQ